MYLKLTKCTKVELVTANLKVFHKVSLKFYKYNDPSITNRFKISTTKNTHYFTRPNRKSNCCIIIVF